jgi:hypothetical protein
MKKRTKLQLNRVTLRDLDSQAMGRLAGGESEDPTICNMSSCGSCAATCGEYTCTCPSQGVGTCDGSCGASCDWKETCTQCASGWNDSCGTCDGGQTCVGCKPLTEEQNTVAC